MICRKEDLGKKGSSKERGVIPAKPQAPVETGITSTQGLCLTVVSSEDISIYSTRP